MKWMSFKSLCVCVFEWIRSLPSSISLSISVHRVFGTEFPNHSSLHNVRLFHSIHYILRFSEYLYIRYWLRCNYERIYMELYIICLDKQSKDMSFTLSFSITLLWLLSLSFTLTRLLFMCAFVRMCSFLSGVVYVTIFVWQYFTF